MLPTQLAANARAVIEVKHAEAPFQVIHHDQDVAISELRRLGERFVTVRPLAETEPNLDLNVVDDEVAQVAELAVV